MRSFLQGVSLALLNYIHRHGRGMKRERRP